MFTARTRQKSFEPHIKNGSRDADAYSASDQQPNDLSQIPAALLKEKKFISRAFSFVEGKRRVGI